MSRTRYIITIAIGILGLVHVISGQQQQLYTMFMYNKLGLNPAYAGYHDHACVTGIYRNQWIGFEGAPVTQMISAQAPLSAQRIGIGMNLTRHEVGISESITADLIYAYRIPVGGGMMSLGAQASLRNMTVDYSNPNLKAVQNINIDPGIDLSEESKLIANFGAGVYYHTERWYAGFSSTRLMRSDIDLESNNLFISRELRHYYLMAGMHFPVNYNLDILPQFLVKYVNPAPVDFDINVSAIWKQYYTLGLTFRTGGAEDDIGESVDIMASAEILPGLLLGVSYDLTFSELKKYSNGSLEVVMRYCFGQDGRGAKFVNPRYF
jgi:type IX secretion system PorP/SprF family membrane protein